MRNALTKWMIVALACSGSVAWGQPPSTAPTARPTAQPPSSPTAAEVEALRQGCETKRALDCGNLGVLYMTGRGVAKDTQRAAPLLRTGCAALPPACTALGLLLLNGDGVPRDAEQARALFEHACDAGEFNACVQLGLGHGTAADRLKGLAGCDRACRQGEPHACYAAGLLRTDTRHPDTVNPNTAFERFRASCDGGYLDGCEMAGALLVNGLLALSNDPLAARLLGRACDGGLPKACELLAPLLARRPELKPAAQPAR